MTDTTEKPDWQPAKSPAGQPTIEKKLPGGITLAVMATPDGGFRAAARLVVAADTLDGAKAAAEKAAARLINPPPQPPAPKQKPNKPKPNPVPGLEREIPAEDAAAAVQMGWRRKVDRKDTRWIRQVGGDGRVDAHITLSADGWCWTVEVDKRAECANDTRHPAPNFAAAVTATTLATEGGAEAIIARNQQRRAEYAAMKAEKTAAFNANADARAEKKAAKKARRQL